MGTIIENLRTFGTFLSLILIPMFLEYGNPLTYKIGALIAAIIFIITFLLGVPGLLEESELIETYYSPNLEPQGGFFTEFFRRFGCVFTKKNYFIYVLRTIGTGAVSFFFFGGIFYYTEIILGMSSYFISYMNLSYFGMIIISIPIGFLMSWFLGYVRVFNIAGFSLGTTILLFPLLGFIPLTAVILMAAVGFFSGISFTCFIPIEGDIFDESASRHRKRSEGFFYGSFALFGGSMTIYVFPIIMTFIHTITGFVPYYGPQPASAIVGIWILFSIIPGLMLIGTQFVFLFVYDLKPRKVEAIQQTLKDLGI